MAIPQAKQAMMAKIHIAKNQLNMDDDSYRAMLNRISGGKTSSSKGLTAAQAEKVLDEFKAKGWQPKPSSKSKGKPHNFKQLPEQITKIEALLSDMKLTWSYADAIAKQMFKVQRCAWLRKPGQLDDIIAALHVEQEKRGLLGQVEELLKLLGEHDPNWQADLESLPKGWQRQRPILKQLVEALSAAANARGLV